MKRLFLLVILFCGCDSPSDTVKKIEFYREPRSKLCFAAGRMQYGDQMSSVFSWVPCEKIPPELIKEP